jgi:hypothetical protein
MNDIDRLKLRQELIGVFSAYVKDRTDVEMKKTARRMHQKYGDNVKNVDRNMSLAIRLLPNIGWEAIIPKPETTDIENLVFSLATRKA